MQFTRGVVIVPPVLARLVLGREVTVFVDTDPVVLTQLVVGHHVAPLVVQFGQRPVEGVVGAVERRVFLASLIDVRLAIGDEERLVFTFVACIFEVLEPVGRGFERVLVVGTATGPELVQRRLQLLQCTRVGQVDRDLGVDVRGEVHQQDIHRTRFVPFDTVGQRLEHGLQGVSRSLDARILHAA
ncbi:hypothetical protein D3C77_386940 [compost metagenome]